MISHKPKLVPKVNLYLCSYVTALSGTRDTARTMSLSPLAGAGRNKTTPRSPGKPLLGPAWLGKTRPNARQSDCVPGTTLPVDMPMWNEIPKDLAIPQKELPEQPLTPVGSPQKGSPSDPPSPKSRKVVTPMVFDALGNFTGDSMIHSGSSPSRRTASSSSPSRSAHLGRSPPSPTAPRTGSTSTASPGSPTKKSRPPIGRLHSPSSRSPPSSRRSLTSLTPQSTRSASSSPTQRVRPTYKSTLTDSEGRSGRDKRASHSPSSREVATSHNVHFHPTGHNFQHYDAIDHFETPWEKEQRREQLKQRQLDEIRYREEKERLVAMARQKSARERVEARAAQVAKALEKKAATHIEAAARRRLVSREYSKKDHGNIGCRKNGQGTSGKPTELVSQSS